MENTAILQGGVALLGVEDKLLAHMFAPVRTEIKVDFLYHYSN